MVTEPDINAIKTRVVAILKKNATLWSTPDHKVGFQKIEVGLPSNSAFVGLIYPIFFIANDENLEEDKPFGPVAANSMGTSEHIFRFKLIFFDHKEDGQEVEKSLDSLQKTIKEVLKANVALQDPDDLPNDPKATESFTRTTRNFSAEFQGKALDGRIILFVVKVHSV